MRSMGPMTKICASWLKASDPPTIMIMMKSVFSRLMPERRRIFSRLLKIANERHVGWLTRMSQALWCSPSPGILPPAGSQFLMPP